MGVLNRRRKRLRSTDGYYRFESSRSREVIQGSGYGDFIRLRDEFGNVWRGEAEPQADDTVRYRLRDGNGRTISGICVGGDVVLRDERGNVWRGFID